MAKKYVGNNTLAEALTIVKTALAGKQDTLSEITAEETQNLWDGTTTAEELENNA